MSATGRMVRIDARTPWAFADVGGIPLCVRACRQARKAGFAGAIVVTGPNVEAARRALARRPAGMPVDVVEHEAREAAAGEVALDGAAVYDDLASPPARTVRDAASRAEAERHVWRRIRKSVQSDGFVAYFLARPVTVPLTRLLVRTRVRANQVTALALLVGVAGGVLAATGRFAAGFGLYFLGSFLDCIDGDIARVRIEGSRLGEWLDTLADDGSTLAITAGTTLGLHARTGAAWVLALGLLAAGAFLASSAYVYRFLARTPGSIDTARFPWWFLEATPVEGGGGGALGWLQYLNRRDFQTAAMFALALAGLVWLDFVWLCAAHLVYASLLCVHVLGRLPRDSARA
ncbi:MAG: CDP-alcohol phosphatidyltransferase family protein [Myxococcota bacterium]